MRVNGAKASAESMICGDLPRQDVQRYHAGAPLGPVCHRSASAVLLRVAFERGHVKSRRVIWCGGRG
jgi:hypothetical protein